MTTIAYRDGVLAADSRETSGCEDSGQLAALCDKIFRVGPFVVALQGDTTPGMGWLHWFRGEYGTMPATVEDAMELMNSPGEPTAAQRKQFDARFSELTHAPTEIVDRFLEHEADFTAVVLCPNRSLFIYDEWGIPQRITAPYYAVGSGAKVAYGAMHHGASATEAVLAACEHDPYTSFPVHSSENI